MIVGCRKIPKFFLQKRAFSAAKIANNASDINIIHSRQLSNWLLAVGASVFCLVTVGGFTRLTRSGLSMTDWNVGGKLPPRSEQQWTEEFSRYKSYPEWQQRQSMTLEEFKSIYYWEYGHRMMGRSIGVVFAVPAMYFAARKMIPKALYPRLGLLFTLGGAQGLIGWWMVRSGLQVDPKQQKQIRVSPYRLATHLSMAFATYGLLVWTAFELRLPNNRFFNPTSAPTTGARAGAGAGTGAGAGAGAGTGTTSTFSAGQILRAIKVRRAAVVATGAVALTAFTGAFVAGNDAGRAFNTFPKMNDEWIPTGILELSPLWRNFGENTATVQFDHRVMALTSTLSVASVFYAAKLPIREVFGYGFRKSVFAKHAHTLAADALPVACRRAVHGSGAVLAVQVGLGISALLTYVPIGLAAAHQAGSMALFTMLLRLVHSLNFVKPSTPKPGLTGVITAIATSAAVAGGIAAATSS